MLPTANSQPPRSSLRPSQATPHDFIVRQPFFPPQQAPQQHLLTTPAQQYEQMNSRTPQPHRPQQRIQQPQQPPQHHQPPQHIQPRPPPIRAAPPQQQDPAQAPHPVSRGPPLGQGQGLLRLLQFSGILASENKTKLQLAWWNDLIREYFTPKAYMKLTLWKDNQRKEAKPFEIGVPILPRFFLVTTQSGVKSMSLSLDGARERYITAGHCIVECVSAVWTYKYNNGYTVTLRGALSAHVIITATSAPGSTAQNSGQPNSSYTFKFDEFTFDANFHDKFIALDAIVGTRIPEPNKSPWIRNAPSPNVNGVSIDPSASTAEEDKRWEEPRVVIERCSIPGEPVNAFGIPQATMRCLELAESVSSMAELITYSTDTQLGPLEALKSLALRIRNEHVSLPDVPQNVVTSGTPATATGIAAAGGAGAVVNGYPGGSHSLPHPPPVPGAPFNPTTLYPGAPGQPAPPTGSGGGHHTPQHGTPRGAHASISSSNTAVNSPQTRPGSAMNSPHKIHKTVQLQPGMGGPHMSGPMGQPGMGPGSQHHSPVTPAMQHHLQTLGGMGGVMGGPMGSMGSLGAPMGGLAGVPPMNSMNMGGAISGAMGAMGGTTPTMATRATPVSPIFEQNRRIFNRPMTGQGKKNGNTVLLSSTSTPSATAASASATNNTNANGVINLIPKPLTVSSSPSASSVTPKLTPVSSKPSLKRKIQGPQQGASPGMVAGSPSLATARTGGPDQAGGKPPARKRARTGTRNG